MKRDFSEQQKQNLKNMAQAVQPDGVFQTVVDWFGDRKLDIIQLLGGLDIDNYLNDMNTYHKNMIDKDNLSAQKIEEIFANAMGVDSSYKTSLSQSCNDISNFNIYLRNYRNCISVGSSQFCSASAIRKIQKKIIEDYETKHPEYKKNMDKFFDHIKNKYPDDVQNIKHIVYNSEEPYRSMFLDNVGNAKWGHTEPYEVKKDGKTETVTDFGNFDPKTNTINLDFSTSLHREKDPRGPYGSFFHEFGHYLDFTYGKGNFYTDSYASQSNLSIDNLIKNDVHNIVEQRVRKTFPKYNQQQVDQITKRLTEGNLPNYPDNDSDQVKNDAIKVQRSIYQDLNTAKKNGVSDSYDSATNYYCNDVDDDRIGDEDKSKETGKGVAGSYQHKDNYYYEFDKNGNLVKTSHTGGKESFATYFSTRIRNSEIGYESYKEYLPETTKEFDIMIKQMTGM